MNARDFTVTKIRVAIIVYQTLFIVVLIYVISIIPIKEISRNNPMALQIAHFILGPIENNTYLIFEDVRKDAMVIDPSFGIDPLIQFCRQKSLIIQQILISHAHFDHIAGVNPLILASPNKPLIGLHQEDLALWKDRGEALQFGFQHEPLPDPDHFFSDGEILNASGFTVTVHHTPGHSPGHVVFSLPEIKTIFTGDVIFAGGIGRTDLTGSDQTLLIDSIQRKILVSTDDTRLLPGHGPETTVGFERHNNSFLN